MNLQSLKRKLWAYPGLRGGGGGTSQDFDGSQLLGNIARDQWAEVKQKIWPVEGTLLASTGGATLPQALAQGSADVNRAFDTQQQGLALDLARRGVTPTAEQAQAIQRNSEINRASALVNAQNTARRGVRERDLSIMSGGLAGGIQIPRGGN